MRDPKRIRSILLALAGVACGVTFFWIVTKTSVAKVLHFQTPRSEILAKAEQAFAESELARYDLRRRIRFVHDKDLSHYLQTAQQTAASRPFPPVAYWSISWRGDVETPDGEEKRARFTVKYDLRGNLASVEKEDPNKADQENLSEPAALATAKSALVAFGVDTTELRQTKKSSSDKDGSLNFYFSFSQPTAFSDDLKTDFTVEILGSEVVLIESTVRVDDSKFTFPKSDKLSTNIAQGVAGVTWLIVCVFLLIILLQRVRHDEVEFKRAIWFGTVSAIVMWVMVGADNLDDILGLVLGGGLAGLFTGLGMMLAFAAAESLTRETTPEKLQLTNLLFRGNLRVKEMGSAILNSFFIAGLALLLFGLIMWLTSALDVGYLDIQDDHVWVFEGLVQTIQAFCEHLIEACFIGVILLFFWGSYLRTKLKNQNLQVALLGLTLVLSGLHLNYIRPSYLSVLFFLPVGFLWAYFAKKHDLLTILLSIFWFSFFSNGGLVGLSPESFGGTAGIVMAVLTVGFFVTGTGLIFSSRSAKDFKDYVPGYVSRIAERERMLKELEIARTVQMKFLPQSIPKFPKLDMAAICRPAMEVGGDYYDFLAVGDDHLSVLIGDVSGKGVSAAFYMTMTSGIVRTLSKRIESPMTILTELNEVFYEYTPRDVFISVIYGRFDMEKKTLTFARAGHNPVMGWKSIGSETKILDSRGIAIGLEDGKLFGATIEEKSIPIESGDLFVFYTDGISEAMNHKADEFGEERLGQLITDYAQKDAQAFLETVTTEVNRFVGDVEQHDDLTMVVVKVR